MNQASDSAVKAIVKAHQFRMTRDSRIYEQSLNHQAFAVSQLRKTLDVSEASLLTVALLAMYEEIMRPQEMLWFSHQQGVVKILLARVQNGICSDIARAIAYGFWGCSFGQACASGEASPYDAPIWLQVEPAWCGKDPPQDVVRLRKSANQLMVRLPRLVALLRKLNPLNGVESQSAAAKAEALDLAKELLDSDQRDAENALLHRVNVIKTMNAFHADLVSHSFVFASVDEMEAAVLYWMCRVHITQLCLNLNDVESMLDGRNPDSACKSPFDRSKLQEEKTRICTNIFMSWQYGQTCGELYAMPIATVLLFVYGALLRDLTFRAKSAKAVRGWILQRYQESAAALPVEVNEAELDRTSSLLLGGEIQGMMVDLQEIGQQVVVEN